MHFWCQYLSEGRSDLTAMDKIAEVPDCRGIRQNHDKQKSAKRLHRESTS